MGARTSKKRNKQLACLAGAAFSMAFPGNLLSQWSPNSNSLPATRSTPASVHDSPFYWPRAELTIPFDVDQAGKLPKEIQLEISADGGRSWNLYARSDLSNSSFSVKSTADGLYMFRLRTLDDRGQAYPNNDAPYRVVIDTQKPTGELVVDVDATGKMVADVRVSDPNLKPESIRLEYQTELQPRWISIPLESNLDNQHNEIVGHGVWELGAGAKRLVVRLVATDQAGNELELTRFPELLRTASVNGGLQLASQKGRNIPGSASSPLQNYRQVGAAASNQTVNSFETPATFDPQARPVGTSAPLASSLKTEGGYTLREIAPEEITVPPPLELPIPETRNKIIELDTKASSSSGALIHSTVVPSSAIPTNTVPVTDAARHWLAQTTRMAELPFFSNSVAFSLDYEVEADARPNVAAIELWGTLDAGKTWERWSQDPDGQSPFDIKVTADGLFGFRMVLVGRNGLMSNRPRDGEQPDVWVMVDTRVPNTKITSASYGRGNETGALILEYTGSDEFASDRPVAFAYAATPDGPWTTIATGLPNTGRFAWSADPALPKRIYLRIEFSDMAGNVAISRLDVPIDVQGLAPRGRINGFRAIRE